jgi:hypothetical protein
MKRYERLGWHSVDEVGIDVSIEGLQTTLEDFPESSDEIDEIVWNKEDHEKNFV